MLFARRLTALRLSALIAVLASTVLVVDHLKPGREFCPLHEACSAAAQSELGTLFGIPTSMLGLAAFAAVVLLTLLPVRLARFLLQPACFVGALGAMGLIAYQAMYLDAFCPLCLVADGAAIVMGYLALTWPPLPLLRTGTRMSAETGAARTAWALALALVVVSPFAYPRVEDTGWEEAPAVADELFEDAVEDSMLAEDGGPAEIGEAPAEAMAEAFPPPVAVPSNPAPPPSAVAAGDAPAASPEPAVLASAAPESPQPTRTPTPEDIAAAVRPMPEPERTPAPRPEPSGVRVIEYLNAFCRHCRATHARLERVVEVDAVPVQRRRVYTWKGSGYPLWARACAYAETIGREDAMFHELTKARRESAGEVYAAAQRAGIDGPAFREALVQTTPPPRLVRDRRIAQAARLTRLPTFDIGRRRLSGSQSEVELRAALRAASRQTTPTDG